MWSSLNYSDVKMWKNKPNWKPPAGNNISFSSHWSYARCRTCGSSMNVSLVCPLATYKLEISQQLWNWVFIWQETLQPRIVISWPFSGWGELASNGFGPLHVFQMLGNHLPANPPLREVSPLLEFSHEVFPADVKSSLKGHSAANLG